jgi:hypothetical protein
MQRCKKEMLATCNPHVPAQGSQVHSVGSVVEHQIEGQHFTALDKDSGCMSAGKYTSNR